ncbi:hypothetical protein KFL_000500050 [Klebsormidium nitens]|uniref:Uncharacterized protein n=1 Tax=Klebsormidium nitens TaxID=105231 RepID=A0A1Y1HQ95_KLENI|nr:hypothetical protein KFL_000500050 [Klebsormidium nitens]|eukprot:GAQ80253.1 hypothetical protein KFL_000500050 [Klebsormidium nitens]
MQPVAALDSPYAAGLSFRLSLMFTPPHPVAAPSRKQRFKGRPFSNTSSAAGEGDPPSNPSSKRDDAARGGDVVEWLEGHVVGNGLPWLWVPRGGQGPAKAEIVDPDSARRGGLASKPFEGRLDGAGKNVSGKGGGRTVAFGTMLRRWASGAPHFGPSPPAATAGHRGSGLGLHTTVAIWAGKP